MADTCLDKVSSRRDAHDNFLGNLLTDIMSKPSVAIGLDIILRISIKINYTAKEVGEGEGCRAQPK